MFTSTLSFSQGVCRAVGIKYGMAHVEVKAQLDEAKKKWIEYVEQQIVINPLVSISDLSLTHITNIAEQIVL